MPDMIIITVSALFTIWYVGAVVFLFGGLGKLKPGNNKIKHKFSIVIAAHNEENNIQACLQSVFAQSVGEDGYEVIVVDDRSTDKTAEFVQEMARSRANLSLHRISETPAGIAPKKHAVAQGVAAAKNEIIVLTDADCIVPPMWLDTIDKQFDDGVGLVQGITTYAYPPGMNRSFFGLQALDFLSHGITAAAAIGAGLPINSNANNLAFRKEAFNAVNGYGPLGAVVSGDDDLLLQRIAHTKKWRVRFMVDPAGAVQTAPTKTLRGIIEQRKRWGSKTIYYNKKQVMLLGGIFGFYCLILANLFTGLFLPICFLLFGGMFAIKLFGEYLILLKGTALFNQKSLRPFIVPASFLQLWLVVGSVVLGMFGSFTWKGQHFRRKA
ncbi:MAG: glycosyltransferase [Chitinivibrionales bacterium]|nr:glycosyltransferase [Chitinivibrionales bacterium]